MSNNSLDILPEPPDELKEISRALVCRIRDRIAAQGPMPFSGYMEMALYEPGLGYYSAGLHKFGADGDFVTAPELGTIFASCLARQIGEIINELGACDILEVGAGSGALAAKLLSSGSGVGIAERLGEYRILDRSADLRSTQVQTLKALDPDTASKVRWVDEPPRESWRGIILANEVLDALAVERFRIQDGEVRQICVDVDGERLDYTEREAPAELAEAVAMLGPLPEGYCSEINLQLPAWVAAITEGLERGVALFIDYGYPRSEYYLDQRSSGTLMAHYRHRAHADLLRYPGLQDLTAWVDFTALAQAAHACSLDLLGYTSQAMFLMGCGMEEVLTDLGSKNPADKLALTTEVKQLTHPSLMGERFQVMALGRKCLKNNRLSGFTLYDWRYRL